MAKYSKQDTAHARERLGEMLTPGTTVYTTVNTVSRSGMSRTLRVFVSKDNEIRDITWMVAALLGESIKEGAVRVQGGGMDMGFHVVYSLGRKLFPEGFAPSERGIRPLDGKTVNVNIGRGRNAGPMRKEEMAELAAKGWRFLSGRNGDTSGWDNDGGYALNHRWL